MSAVDLQLTPSSRIVRPAGQSTFWAVIDLLLLLLTLMVSCDMFIRLGPIQLLAWLACYGLALLRIGMFGTAFYPVLQRNTVVFAYPAVCLASVLWSVFPLATLMAAIQLGMTLLIATYLGWRYSMATIAKALLVVLSLAVVLSLLHWATSAFPWEVYSPVGGLVGVFSQKNMLGQRSLFAVVVIIAILLMPDSLASRGTKTVAGFMLGLVLFALFLSKSMTSVLLVPVLAGLLMLICVRRLPTTVVMLLGGFALLAVALGPVLLALAGIDLVKFVLDGVGKDSTLTGRTVLWQMGADTLGQNMPLGVGFGAFWKSADFANEQFLAQEFGETVRAFHNFILEVLVGTGLPGLLAMLFLLASAASRLTRTFLRKASVPAALGLTLMMGILAASSLGPSLYRAHEFMIVLLVMFMVSAGEENRRT